jgi:hypothetical protein
LLIFVFSSSARFRQAWYLHGTKDGVPAMVEQEGAQSRIVMPGLVAGIHAFLVCGKNSPDERDSSIRATCCLGSAHCLQALKEASAMPKFIEVGLWNAVWIEMHNIIAN